MHNWKHPKLLVLVLAVFLAGCLPAGPKSPADAAQLAAQATLAAMGFDPGSPAASPQNASPAGLLPVDRPALEESFPPALAAPLAADPLAISFPAQSADPVSNLRPPLYPTPWEPTPQDHFFFSRPIGVDNPRWILSIYRYGFLLYNDPHTGIDIPGPIGTSIMAAGSGTVVHAGYGLYLVSEQYRDPYGIAVAIKHDFGYQGKVLYTIYGHMQKTIVYPGQRVEAGDVIGLVGLTGKTSGPHLHLEVRLGEQNYFSSRNPELWIPPPQGWGLVVGRIAENSGRKIPEVKIKLVNKDTGRVYETLSYAPGSVNSDDYYDENFALGDLPAGSYRFSFDAGTFSQSTDIEINPGMVTYLTYAPRNGFSTQRPLDKSLQFAMPSIE